MKAGDELCLPCSRWKSTDVSEDHVTSIFFLGLFFDPEDAGGNKFLRNVGRLSTAKKPE
jgi:hypothetical protein